VLLDDIAPGSVPGAEAALRRAAREDLPDLAAGIEKGDALTPDRRQRLVDSMRRALGQEVGADGDA
jgi:hypothetical protein